MIPFGGGTTVSNAVTCPSGEKRMIVTVSTAHMTAIKWVDRENMLACVEAGVRGVCVYSTVQAQSLWHMQG